MRKFRVKTSSVGGLGNQVFEGGDIVTEENFPQGNADLLVKDGFLEEVPEDTVPTVEQNQESKNTTSPGSEEETRNDGSTEQKNESKPAKQEKKSKK